ncbi:MAG: phosphoribosylaminoimidazolesuccinocarboxamide synthase [bacterium]|nr:phosphoribosylaminoimidazolesuccinocarboxamide synthase [bacterium]
MLTEETIHIALSQALRSVDLVGFGAKTEGKVRDIYHSSGKRILITTDRVSAFDRVLGVIPFKGQVLNQLSLWWFEQTADIVPNHVLTAPDPNVTIAREAQPLPIEVIVRGYITGVTSTSLWTLYQQGERAPYGIALPEGLQKNDRLPQPIITPTTKAEQGAHDERITREEILTRGLVEADLWAQIEQVAPSLFLRGQKIAERAGLILVDTKYEFGLIDGQLTLIDEIHTPDSSRYWTQESYNQGEPEHFDKEYLRLWFAAQGYRGEGQPPVMPLSLITQISKRYISMYEFLTGNSFVPAETSYQKRIQQSLSLHLLRDVHDSP